MPWTAIALRTSRIRRPGFLREVAGRVEELIDRHGHVLVLVIHGWNVVEARIDFGLGARYP